jgi:hypothetical protein
MSSHYWNEWLQRYRDAERADKTLHFSAVIREVGVFRVLRDKDAGFLRYTQRP